MRPFLSYYLIAEIIPKTEYLAASFGTFKVVGSANGTLRSVPNCFVKPILKFGSQKEFVSVKLETLLYLLGGQRPFSMEKLLGYFERKFDENFKKCSPSQAFEKTIEQVGFQAYANQESFERARRKRKRGK